MEDVSEVLRPLVEAASGELIVYVTGYPDRSWRLQRELQTAGVTEVATSVDPLIRVRLPSATADALIGVPFPRFSEGGVVRTIRGPAPTPETDSVGTLPPPTTPASQERRISIDFREAPLALVLTAFSRLSDRTIVAAEGVSAVIDADIVDQPWDEALRTILSDHGLVGVQDAEGNIRVERRDLMPATIERDLRDLRAAWEEWANGTARIEVLQVIPAARASSELSALVSDLVTARAELRVLRDRYADDYPPIQDVLREICRSCCRTTVPSRSDGFRAAPSRSRPAEPMSSTWGSTRPGLGRGGVGGSRCARSTTRL